MIAPVCQHEKRKRFGVTKSGTQRFRCLSCKKTFTASTETFDGMRVGMERAAFVIQHLCEGTSVRATARLCGMDVHTILDLLVMIGQRCKRFLAETLQNIEVKEVQCDEIWGFVGMKQRTANFQKLWDEPVGDCYTFTAIERSTKLLVAWHMGRRDDGNTQTFVEKLQDAACGHFHVSTDGFSPYPGLFIRTFGRTIEYGRIIKRYGYQNEVERRTYSPPSVTSIERDSIIGSNAKDRACTSHMERCNATIRLFNKRMARLTYCFSKKWGNHEAAMAFAVRPLQLLPPPQVAQDRQREADPGDGRGTD